MHLKDLFHQLSKSSYLNGLLSEPRLRPIASKVELQTKQVGKVSPLIFGDLLNFKGMFGRNLWKTSSQKNNSCVTGQGMFGIKSALSPFWNPLPSGFLSEDFPTAGHVSLHPHSLSPTVMYRAHRDDCDLLRSTMSCGSDDC